MRSKVLPEGWEEKQLNTLIDVTHGYAFKGSDFSDTATSKIVLTPGNFKIKGGFKKDKFKYLSEAADFPESYILKNDDLLITMTDLSKIGDTLGYPALMPAIKNTQLLHNQRLGKVIFKSDEIDKLFLYYALCTDDYRNEVLASATGTTVKHTAPTRILNYKLKYPSTSKEQQKIASILSSLDDKIELNTAMNQTLEALAQTIFKSWFVDFAPFKEGKFIESKLGMIPEGWEIVKIDALLKRHKVPKRYKKNDVNSFGKTLVFEQGTNIILGYHHLDGEFKATTENPMFIFGDHTCIMTLSTKPFSISENVIPIEGKIRNSYWTYFAIYGKQTFQEYRRHWAELVVKEVLLPDKDSTDNFAEIVKPLILKIEENIQENSTLTQLKNILLPKLMSGEVRV